MNPTTKEQQQRVLVAGATGYVGQQLVAELLERGYAVRGLVRQPGRLAATQSSGSCEEVVGDVLGCAEALRGAASGCDCVVSCVGGSMLAAGRVEDVFRPTSDGNTALFETVRAAGARRFVMLASLNSEACRDEFEGFKQREAAIDRIRHLAELDARKSDGDAATTYTVVDLSGFFKDYDRIFRTVRRKRRASAIGPGFSMKSNPIHPRDLAARIADSLERPEERNSRIAVGGPDILSLRQIAVLAAEAADVSRLRYTAVPLFVLRLMAAFLWALSWLWPGAGRYVLFAQFIRVIQTHDSVGERCGKRHLRDHFRQLAAQHGGG